MSSAQALTKMTHAERIDWVEEQIGNAAFYAGDTDVIQGTYHDAARRSAREILTAIYQVGFYEGVAEGRKQSIAAIVNTMPLTTAS